MWRPVGHAADTHAPYRKETRTYTTPARLDLPSPTLLTPECDAPGCSVAGDQYTLIRCRGCGAWFCPEHIAAAEGVTLVRPASRALSSFAYYQGRCVACQQARQRTHH